MGLHLGGVVQTIHHPSDTTMLECLGDGLPPILNQLGSIPAATASGVLGSGEEGKWVNRGRVG